MGAHAFLAPSSADRWVRCALAPTLEAAHPEIEASPSSLEGTAAHWVVQMLLQGTPVALDMQAPNGIAVTEEMLEAAEVVRDDIYARLGPEWQSLLFIERPVPIARVHPTQNWGTPDYSAWSRMENKNLCLHLWDFKYGHGVVEAFENWQMIDYVDGLLEAASIDGLQEQTTFVEMTVIQPRAFHRDGPVRRWRVLASDLRAYFNRLQAAATEATGPNPSATPTPEGCEHCRGRHACEALQRAAYTAAERGRQYGALDLTPHALGLELRALKRAQALLEARVSGLEAEAVSIIKRGEQVPFWSLESTPGRLAWQKPAAEILALGQMMGLDLAKPPECITPTQAKAAAKAAKLPGEIFDVYAARPAGTAKLTYDDGKKARLTFSTSNT